jgi:hypothetical protein
MLYSCGIEKNNIMVNFHVASINPFLNLEPTHRWPLCRWSTLGGMLELHGYLHGDLWVAGIVFGSWQNHVSHPTLPEHAGHLQIYFYFKILQCTVCLLSTIQQIPADCFMWIETKLSVSFLKKKHQRTYSTTHCWLVVSTHLKNMSSSVGITIPNIWKVIKFMFQNHQPDWINSWLKPLISIRIQVLRSCINHKILPTE